MNSEDDRLVVYETVASLERSALLRIAVSLWCREIQLNVQSFRVNLCEKVYKSIATLPLRESIQNELKTYIEPIEEAIYAWSLYHHYAEIFDVERWQDCKTHVAALCPHNINVGMAFIASFVDDVEWKSNGFIDYARTARNLIRSPKLTVVEKYRMMCEYCMEDTMHEIPAEVYDGRTFDEINNLQTRPLVYYWGCHLRGELNGMSRRRTESQALEMIVSDQVYTEQAIMYFWRRLNEDDKPEIAIRLIMKYGLKCQAMLLNELNGMQQREVFYEIIIHIMTNYATSVYWLQAASDTWERVCNGVSNNQFRNIMDSLLTFKPNSYRAAAIKQYLRWVGWIWDCADDSLKTYVANFNNGALLMKIIKLFTEYVHADCDLLEGILSYADLKVKETVGRCGKTALLIGTLMKIGPSTAVDRLLKGVCDIQDIGLMKQMMVNDRGVRESCMELCFSERVDEMNEILEVCLPDARAIAEYKARTFVILHGEVFDLVQRANEENLAKYERFFSEMLSGASAGTRMGVITADTGIFLFTQMMATCNYKLADFFLRLCLPADQVEKFKRLYIKGNWGAFVPIRILQLNDQSDSASEEIQRLLNFFFTERASLEEYKARVLFSRPARLWLVQIFQNAEDPSNVRICCCNRISALMLMLLGDVSMGIKSKVIYSYDGWEFCKFLLKKGQYMVLNYYIDLSLLENERIPLKKRFFKMLPEKCPFFLLQQRKYEEVDAVIDLCVPGMKYFKQHSSEERCKRNTFVTNINKHLRSVTGTNNLIEELNTHNYSIIGKLIYKVFHCPDAAIMLAQKVLMNDLVLYKFDEWIADGKLDQVKNCVAVFIGKNRNDVKIMKERLFQYYNSQDMTRIFTIFDETSYENFLKWCLKSEQLVMQYKSGIQIQEVFVQMLKNSVFARYDNLFENCVLRAYCDFSQLDRFLRWYFEDESSIEDFKLDWIANRWKIDMIEKLLLKEDHSHYNTVFEWFFDGVE